MKKKATVGLYDAQTTHFCWFFCKTHNKKNSNKSVMVTGAEVKDKVFILTSVYWYMLFYET